MKMHQKALDFFQEWYNFIKPHESLKEKIDSDRGKWLQKTPAIKHQQ
jgi:transposase InsO family protein